ncbi:uncharacterized protein LOC101771981 [Setaria italica]|uniref:uncharacterized protein LOC101771981 n=1 Tax=Setaria italica TaxID=4555 RepID=UPI000BE5146A|nr:uncharacterized protein LOC101771981 [Setaria italica]
MLCAAARRWGRGFALPPAEDTPRRTVNGPQAARPSMNPQVAKLRCSQDPATFPPSVVAAHGTPRQPVLPVGSILPLLIRCFDSTGWLPKQVHGGILLDVKKARYTMGESLQEGHQKKAR